MAGRPKANGYLYTAEQITINASDFDDYPNSQGARDLHLLDAKLDRPATAQLVEFLTLLLGPLGERSKLVKQGQGNRLCQKSGCGVLR